jgi:hypothetical protein
MNFLNAQTSFDGTVIKNIFGGCYQAFIFIHFEEEMQCFQSLSLNDSSCYTNSYSHP